MYIKVVTVKVKRKKYRYVKVMTGYEDSLTRQCREKVVGTLGRLEDVRLFVDVLQRGLERLKGL